MAPHLSIGTHVFIINKYKTIALEKRENKLIMAQVKSNYDEHYRISKTSKLFAIVKQGEKLRIVMGEYVASDKTFDTFEQAEKYIASKPYELLINMILISYKYEKENEKKTNEQTKENA